MPEPSPRRSIRLPGYDYASAGAYFVTICAYQRKLLFEDAFLAAILEEEWRSLPGRFIGIRPDAFVVMPNHVHFIVWLGDPGKETVAAPLAGASAGASPAPTLGDVVGAYKSLVAVRWLRWVRANRPDLNARIWQQNYYERIIRNEDELNRIREYIAYNPIAWRRDHENPDRVPAALHDDDWSWLEDHAP